MARTAGGYSRPDGLAVQQNLRMRVVIGRRHLAGVKAAVGVGICDAAGSEGFLKGGTAKRNPSSSCRFRPLGRVKATDCSQTATARCPAAKAEA